jgi:hypothetical protein
MLSENLKILLATSYAFVIKAQNFHWNIEGSNFPQYSYTRIIHSRINITLRRTLIDTRSIKDT